MRRTSIFLTVLVLATLIAVAAFTTLGDSHAPPKANGTNPGAEAQVAAATRQQRAEAAFMEQYSALRHQVQAEAQHRQASSAQLRR